MTESIKFDPKNLAKLNDPERFKILNPDIIWNTLNLQNPKTLVDIGAGTGFFASFFCNKIKEGQIYACDTSNIMVDWMKEHLHPKYRCKIIPTKCEEAVLPISSEVADLVYLINVFHELESPNETIAEASRVLKKNGKIAIIDWKTEETAEGPPLSIRISESVVCENLTKAGLSKIKIPKVLPFHYFLIAEKFIQR